MGFDNRNYYRPQGFGGFSFFPPVIKKLLIINVVVYFVMILAAQISVNGPVTLYHYIMKYFALLPFGEGGVYVQGAGYLPASFLPWQVITYQFMHDIHQFSHILFNMFMLWMFGMEIENLWGSRKFLFYYLLTGTGAAIFQLLFSSGGAPTIGASGAVFGIMIAFAMMFPNRYIFLYFLIPIKAKYLIAILVVFEFMSVGDMSFVAHIAHVGGALTGVVFILLDRRKSFNIDGLFNKIKNIYSSNTAGQPSFRKNRLTKNPFEREVQDAEFYDINSNNNTDPDQDEIDRILDKISRSGYQNLTEREKRILFEASKKK